MLLLYINDMLITGNGSEIQRKFLKDISIEFCMKDLGQMEYLWGIQAKLHRAVSPLRKIFSGFTIKCRNE